MNKRTRSILITLIIFTAVLAVLTGIFFYLHKIYEAAWLRAAAITLLTVFYHFAMRLVIGEAVTLICRNRHFPTDRFGFRIYSFEDKCYRRLHVRRWKAGVITAKPEQFDFQHISPEELLFNVMQAELVHRIIAVLSFVPILFAIPFGEPAVFIITSVAACLIDLRYVIIQRFNRPRVIRYMEHLERRRQRISS